MGTLSVMGMHWQSLGYSSLQEFINGIYRSEGDHLDSFIRYVETNGLAKHLRSKDWAAFALGYNGKDRNQPLRYEACRGLQETWWIADLDGR